MWVKMAEVSDLQATASGLNHCLVGALVVDLNHRQHILIHAVKYSNLVSTRLRPPCLICNPSGSHKRPSGSLSYDSTAHFIDLKSTMSIIYRRRVTRTLRERSALEADPYQVFQSVCPVQQCNVCKLTSCPWQVCELILLQTWMKLTL